MYLCHRSCYAGLLLDPAEDSSLVYSMSKLEVLQEVVTVAVGWNSCVQLIQVFLSTTNHALYTWNKNFYSQTNLHPFLVLQNIIPRQKSRIKKQKIIPNPPSSSNIMLTSLVIYDLKTFPTFSFKVFRLFMEFERIWNKNTMVVRQKKQHTGDTKPLDVCR